MQVPIQGQNGPRLIGTVHELADLYASALQEYLSGNHETGLLRAYKLGRKAICGDLGVLEIVSIHETVQESLSHSGQSEQDEDQLRERAVNVLIESLSAFEMAWRGYHNEGKQLRHHGKHDSDFSSFLFASPKLAQIVALARQVAGTDVPVLISGETGVGKEVLARFVHSQSDRMDKPFLKVNCAAVPFDLLESELFGYDRGAFSGAVNEKPGVFELAGEGTILLDEISEMRFPLQAKLLHVLQDGSYTRLGGRRAAVAKARVLAATNRRLQLAVSQGEFREDLYYRLNVVGIEIPPLRERREDIPLLCNWFLEKYGERYKSPIKRLQPEPEAAVQAHEWPGNVRQLENFIRRFLILPDVTKALALLQEGNGRSAAPAVASRGLKIVSAQAAEDAEKEMILSVLGETKWNRKRAARELGICYKALLNKLKKWEIDKRLPEAAPFQLDSAEWIGSNSATSTSSNSIEPQEKGTSIPHSGSRWN